MTVVTFAVLQSDSYCHSSDSLIKFSPYCNCTFTCPYIQFVSLMKEPLTLSSCSCFCFRRDSIIPVTTSHPAFASILLCLLLSELSCSSTSFVLKIGKKNVYLICGLCYIQSCSTASISPYSKLTSFCMLLCFFSTSGFAWADLL